MLHRRRVFRRGSENHRQKTRSRPEKELGRGIDVLLMGAQIMLSEEEFALNTGQRSFTKDATVMGVQILLSREDCVLGMEQSTNDALLMGVQIKSSKEEFALSTGRRLITNGAA